MKKVIIIMLLVLFVLITGIEIYVQSDTFALKIRSSVVESLKDILGDDAEIGWVKANFIPPYLEVRDISMRDADGKPAVSIRKLTIYINPVPLLLKKIRLPIITIAEPRLYAERTKDGALNLTPLIDRIRANIARKEAEGPSGYSLLLRTLSLRKGRIEFKDGKTSALFSVTDLDMSARVNLAQDQMTASIGSSHISVSAPAYPAFSGKLKTELKYDRGRISMTSVELLTADAAITMSGEAGLSSDAALDLRIKARSGPQVIGRFLDILRPSKKPQASRFDFSAHIGGKLSAPVVEGNLSVSSLPLRGYLLRDAALTFAYRDKTILVEGRHWKLAREDADIVIDSIDAALGYSRGGIDIRRADILAGDLTLHAQGRADPSTGYDVLLTAGSSGKGNTASFLSSVPVEGAVNVTGHLSGALASPRFDGAVAAGPVVVRGVLFKEVDGGITYGDKKIRLSSVKIAEQASRYIFDGSLDLSDKEPLYSGRLRVLHSDVVNIVALFYEKLPLKLSAAGELTFNGTARNYSGNGFLKLDAGSAYGESFVRGVVTASLSTGRIAFPQVALYKERGGVRATGWIGFDGTYAADLESIGIDLSAIDHLGGLPFGGEFKLDIHSSGSFSRPLVTSSLEIGALSFRQKALGTMHADAAIRNEVLTFRAGFSDARSSMSARWELSKPYPWTVEAKIGPDIIDPFLMLENKGFADRVKVIADGTVTAHGRGFDWSSISGKAVFPHLAIVIGDYRIVNESDATLSMSGGRLTATSLNLVGPDTRITLTGWAKPMAALDITMEGTANLSLLKLLYPEVEYAAGFAELKLEIKNGWKNPDVSGELRLKNGEIKIKDIPQRFTALNTRIVFTQGRIVADSLSGEMGGGTLSASGWVQLSGMELKEFSAKASVENVTVRYPEGLTSTLSGELDYDGDPSAQSLSGDIIIKRARYDKRVEWKSMLVDIGRGLYQKKKTEVGWIGDTQINIRFHGTDDILFQNNLATMPLDVDVFLRGTVNHPQLLGRIDTRKGVVYFRKNEFKILSASVDFIDPNRMNPVLDIQAETQVREYLIRLAVTGTAERAVVTFISEPSLIDTDILSLLALGKTGAELKGKETGVGVGEAASFATGQFQDIFESRARSLTGLDRFQVDPYVGKSDTSVPRITASKELVKNKLYLTYSSNVGAAAPEQIFRIEYMLNRQLSIVGERNEEVGNNGADIKYRFEFQ